MAYAVDWLRSAQKDLSQLSITDRERVLAAVGNLGVEPRPAGVTALTGYERTYRIRVGDNRVVYQIDDSAQKVTVIAVGSRGDIYRRIAR